MSVRNLRTALLFLLLAAVGVTLSACAQKSDLPAMYANMTDSGAKIDAEAALQLINGHRDRSGLPPLEVDAVLMEIADGHARAMAAKNKVGGDVGDGGLAARLAARGIAAPVRSENVSAGYLTLAEAFSGWRGSDRHNETMLLAEGRRMGIAAAYAPGSKYRVFWSLIVAGEEPATGN